MGSILTYVLHYEGAFNKNSLGAVSEASKLATKVFRANGPEGLAQPVIDVMAKVIDENGHSYALFGGGLLGFEIGAGLAARKKAGVTMEVTEVKVDGDELVAARPILQDSKISESRYKGDLGVIIGRLNAFEAKEGDGTATVED